MNKKTVGYVLMMTVICCLLAAGLVLLGISIFGNNESEAHLPIALGCITVANCMIAVRNHRLNKKP